MGRRSKNESLLEMLVGVLRELLEAIFHVVPPWSSIPLGLVGFCLIWASWVSLVPMPQLQNIGLLFGGLFAVPCFIAGWKGVQFRKRQQAFIAADLDLNWGRGLSWRGF